MKKSLLTGVIALAFIGIVQADCTVTTDCETRNYEGNSLSATSYDGVVTVTRNGQTIDTFTCNSGGVHVSCSSSGGNGDGNYGGGNYGGGNYGGGNYGGGNYGGGNYGGGNYGGNSNNSYRNNSGNQQSYSSQLWDLITKW